MSAKRRASGPFITGIDVGTSKICVVVAEAIDDGIEILSISSTPSAGLRKGVVINTDSASAAIRDALAAARQQSGVSIREALVSISGNHIQVSADSATVAVSGKNISQADVDKVIDDAGAFPVTTGREILHMLPTEFIVDGSRGIKDPLGLPGFSLEAHVNIITSSAEPLRRLIMSCEKAGIQVSDVVLHSIASAEAAMTSEDRDMGTAIVDIGAGTTDIALFKDGWLQHAAVLGIGGNHFTNDLSVGLRVPFAEAERVKKQFGMTAIANSEDEEIDVVGLDGEVRKISRHLVTEILQLRCEELFELIQNELKRPEVKDAITGTVFTGGAVLVPGFIRLAETAIVLPIRTGRPDLTSSVSGQAAPSLPFVKGVKDQYQGPEYAAAVGLVLYGSGYSASTGSDDDPGLLNKMTRYFKNIMGKNK
ncbi:MAG TPA: cell division protein FtsA [Dissulfurispiraceae bacterium]|nr:cell division protein FtsA [Dissulfurispiraceae bacterium]